ncbi:MAG: hypothetical protein KDB04_17455 [Acidimicrobiales bacterium]|nr:hypothetical protein [Acidimicrobiales bacterium]HRW37405.1 hypothetical protein [Aquihabitans sp.]
MSAALGRPGTALEAVTDLLDLRPGAPRPGTTRLGVVAGRGGPRFLVPVSHPDAAPEVCLAYLGLRDARTRVQRGAVGWALRAGAERLVVRDELLADAGPGSLLHLLEELLHDDDHEPGLAVGIGLGHRDEVWKPTLQLFRPDGTPAAFVKVGLGPVADQLVATEAAALAAWARHPDPRLVVPDLLAATTWNGIRIAVVAPLPEDVRRLPPGTPSAWAVRDLDGPPSCAALADAPWWTRRTEREGDGPVRTLLEQIGDRHADATGSWARWHGDWVPWNLARCHRGLVAWDWEYSEPDAPVGLDEVHGAYQQARIVEQQPIAAALEVARLAAERLVAAGTSPGSPAELRRRAGTDEVPSPFPSARWLADLHLAMLLTRSTELERLAGTPPHDRAELLAAAEAGGRRR